MTKLADMNAAQKAEFFAATGSAMAGRSDADKVAAGLVAPDLVARAATARLFNALSLNADDQTYDFYVSPSGNDLDHGRSRGAPFKTVAAAISAVGSQSGASIGLMAGADYRGQSNRLPVQSLINLRVGRWGQGTMPRILGATRATAGWSAEANGEYSTPLAYTPANVFWQVAPSGLITKLYPSSGTAYTPGAVPLNGWTVSGGKLYIKIGKDPSADYIEVTDNIANPLTNDSAVCLFAGAGAVIRDVAIMMWPGSGGYLYRDNATIDRCEVSYCGNDGLDMSAAVKNFRIANSFFRRNGTVRGIDTGPGDAVSCHQDAQGVVEACGFYDNDRAGVGNQASAQVRTTRCYFEGNFRDYAVYQANDGAAGGTGQHALDYSIFRRTASDEGYIVIIGAGSNPYPVTGKVHNNTIYNPAGSPVPGAFSSGMAITRGVWDVQNNVIRADQQSVNGISQYADAVVSTDYNTISGVNSRYQPGSAPTNQGTNDSSSDPLLIDGANRNYGLRATSPARGAGKALGYTVDFFGNPVPAVNPDRGAVQRL